MTLVSKTPFTLQRFPCLELMGMELNFTVAHKPNCLHKTCYDNSCKLYWEPCWDRHPYNVGKAHFTHKLHLHHWLNQRTTQSANQPVTTDSSCDKHQSQLLDLRCVTQCYSTWDDCDSVKDCRNEQDEKCTKSTKCKYQQLE